MVTATRPLRVRNYRLYFTGQVTSLSGTWMQTAGLAWLVLHLTGSGTMLGLVTAAQFVPTLLGSAWGGLLADRLDKHRTLLVTQTGLGLTAGALAAVTLSGRAEVWMLVLLSVLAGVFTTVDNPVRQSFVTEVVDAGSLPTAVALNSVMFNSARIVGPALASVIIDAFSPDVERGTGLCFAANAVSYLAVILCLALMRRADLRPAAPIARSRGQIRAAVVYAMGVPALRTILAMMSIIGLLVFNYQVLLPLVARNVFSGDARTFGLLSVAMGSGALVGSLAAAGRGRASPRLITGGAAVLGACMLAAAAAPVLSVALVAWALVGASMMTLMSAASTTLQLATRPDMRGRVIALYMLLLMGSTPIGGPIMGWLAQNVGTRFALAVGGVSCLVAAVISLRSPAHAPTDADTVPDAGPAAERAVAGNDVGDAPGPAAPARA